MRAHAFVWLAAALALPAPAAAQVEPWVGLTGDWATYSMTDVNHELDTWTAALSGTGMSMKAIHDGFGYGAEVGVEVSGEFGFGVGYDHLVARSQCSGEYGSFDYSVPANSVRVFLEYRPPASSTLAARFGLSAGVLMQHGAIAATPVAGSPFSGTTYGTGPLFEVYAGATWRLTSRLAMSTTLGHRRAKINVLAVEAGDVSYIAHNPDGSKESADYGGVFTRVGLEFAVLE